MVSLNNKNGRADVCFGQYDTVQGTRFMAGP